METMRFGKYALIKMDVQEYNAKYECNMQERFGYDLQYIMWVEKYDSKGELIAMSEENMLVFEGNVFGYTSRGLLEEAELGTCLEVIGWLEKL